MKGSKMKKMKKRILAALLCTTMMLNTGVSAMADGGTAVSSESAHVHTEECYEKSKTDNLICTKAEAAEGHVHGDTCYEVTSTPELICTQAETAGHIHGDSCMETTKNVICGKEEHTHGDGCVETEEVLTCTAEEHTHADGCYEVKTNIVCGQDEVEAHTHGEGCYTAVKNKTLKCTLEEAEVHTHNDDCYVWEDKLVCTIEETKPAQTAENGNTQEPAEEQSTKETEVKEEPTEVNLQNDDETGIKVSVKSTSDVLSEDTKVVVASMEMDEEHEAALAEAVSEFEVLGYTAYDISLKDAEDEDITLGENKVEVAIDFEELIPEGIDAEEVKDVVLVHITTDEEEKLTAKAVGTVEITEEKATVEFEADSFSPYVVTYLSEAEEVVEEPIEEPAEEAVATECVFENDEMIVTVISETDNLDAVASIFVKQVAEEDEQYEVITQQLTEAAAENGKSSLGFYAYDIDFYDAAGNGIAVDGNVKVNVEFKEGKIPAEAEGENVDQVEVTVLDLDIDETEEAVLTDANGIYSAEECKVTEAAYTTENPDGFVLAWHRNGEIVLETKVNGTVIKMTGPAKSFPEGTEYSISAKELTSTQQDDVEAALRKMELEKETKVVSYQAYDIKLIVDGNETQPLGEVKVTFEGGAVEEKVDGAETVDVFHIDEAKQVAQPITNEINDNTVEMTTNHFSTYVITTTNTEGVDITVQHYLTEGKTELYRESIEHLKVTEKIEDISVAANYTVDKVVKIEGAKETEITGDQVITADTTYRVYYTPTTGKTTGDVQVFDYQVNPENGASINLASNYAQESTSDTRMASGKIEHNVDATKYYAKKKQNEKEYNVNDFVGYGGPALTGLVTGVNYETGELVMGNGDSGKLYEPGFFTKTPKSGKQIYADDYTLEFSRTGDTYEFTRVLKGGSEKAKAGEKFFPLDDIRYGYRDQANSGTRNFFFGLRYDIEFSIGDYNGSLEYKFTGDDDLWVVLDAKDNGGNVVIDLGGIHQAKDGSVDIWKALGVTPETITDDQRAQTHTLTILYMERGAGESNCQMEFTLPNSKVINAAQNPISYSFRKVNSTGVGIAGGTFGLYDQNGTLLKTASSTADGTVTFTSLYDGVYVVKETKAPSGYVKVETEWQLTVGNETAVMTVTGAEEPVTQVVNYTEKEEATRNLTNGKNVSVVNEQDRTFKINLTAATTGETQGTAAKAASIVLVLDASDSMKNDGAFGSLKNAVAGTNTQEGFIDKIASVSPASKIGIVWYNGEETKTGSQTSTKSFMKLESNDNISELKRFVNDKDASSGTPMGDGLEAAYNMLKADTSGNEKYVIFFTDGMPGYWETAYDDSSNTRKNCMVANNAVNYANKIKDTNDGNAVLYTVGYNLGTDSFYWTEGHTATGSGCGSSTQHGEMTGIAFLSTKIATSSEHAYTASDIDALKKRFDELAAELGELFKVQAKSIVDIVDARFELTAASEAALKAQYGKDVSIVKNTDGTTTITWTGGAAMIQNAANGGWAAEFVVQAKPEFVGGNMIPTNGADSGINLEGDQNKPFPQPSVNVKLLEPSLSGGKYTIYKGDEDVLGEFVGNLADSLTITKLYSNIGDKITVGKSNIPKLTDQQITALKEGTAIEVDYSYANTGDVVGKFKYEYDTATATLKVTFIANTVDERSNQLSGITQPAQNGGTVVEQKSVSASNEINIISGAIQINKILDKAATENQTFTFTINYVSPESKETTSDSEPINDTETVEDTDVAGDVNSVNIEENTFPMQVNVTVNGGSTKGTYKLEGLARGTYTVVENEVKGYVLESVATNASTNCQSNTSENSVTYILGNDKSGKDVIKEYKYNQNDGGTLGVVDVNNEKALLDWNIIKRSSSSDKKILGGAEFSLKSKDAEYKGISDSSGVIKWYTIEDGKESMLEEGEYIQSGVYTFEEKVAPGGYAVSGEKWEITIGSYGSLKSITGNLVEPVPEGEAVYYYFENTPLYELPSTGGHGIYTTMLSGFALMLGAAYVWFASRREESSNN